MNLIFNLIGCVEESGAQEAFGEGFEGGVGEKVLRGDRFVGEVGLEGRCQVVASGAM